MTGPEHYREAEKLLNTAWRLIEQAEASQDGFKAEVAGAAAPLLTARAQVHATLALAAASVESASDTRHDPAWIEATA